MNQHNIQHANNVAGAHRQAGKVGGMFLEGTARGIFALPNALSNDHAAQNARNLGDEQRANELGAAASQDYAEAALEGMAGGFFGKVFGSLSRGVKGNIITAGRGNLCVPCAIVEDARIGGDYSLTVDDVVAHFGKNIDGFEGLKKGHIEQYFGSKFEFAGGRISLDKRLKSLGKGSKGIVYGTDSVAGEYHAFNFQVGKHGSIKYTDTSNPDGIGMTLDKVYGFMNNLSFLKTN